MAGNGCRGKAARPCLYYSACSCAPCVVLSPYTSLRPSTQQVDDIIRAAPRQREGM